MNQCNLRLRLISFHSPLRGEEMENGGRDDNRIEKQQNAVRGNGEKQKDGGEEELPLMALNHVSRLCRSVKDSVDFYTKVLGFVLIERPQTFDFDGAWLFNYGIGVHLVQSKDEDKLSRTDDLDPMDNHISFQCEDMGIIERKLKDMDIEYRKRTVENEKGESMDQLFFKDPDGFMIEICNCENLKLVPKESFDRIKLPLDRHNPPIQVNDQQQSELSSEL